MRLPHFARAGQTLRELRTLRSCEPYCQRETNGAACQVVTFCSAGSGALSRTGRREPALAHGASPMRVASCCALAHSLGEGYEREHSFSCVEQRLNSFKAD